MKAPSCKILITGDIRDYDYNDYPKFENVDLCISHLWAGRDSVDEKLYIPMLEKFSETISSFDAKKYFLCHLYEIGRGENSMWSYKHTGLAMDMIYSLKPQAIVEAPKVFYGYNLFE